MSGTDHSSMVPLRKDPPVQGNAMGVLEIVMDESLLARRERTDSGFDDITVTPQARRSRSTSVTSRDHTPTPTSRKRKHRQPRRTISSSEILSTSRSSSPKPSTPPDSSRPTSSRRKHSRQSSVSTTARRSSRQTSLLLHQRVSSYNSTQPLLYKHTFSSYIHLHENPFLPPSHTKSSSISHENPFLSHTRSTSFSPNLPARGTFPRSSSPQHLRSPSLPTLPSTFPPRTPSPNDTRPVIQARSYSNFVPATTIDWTLPSTRQKEYAEIDRKCSGIRGLWRKLAPSWCQRDKERGFWDEKRGDDGDGGSVRRYRIDLDGETTAAGDKESSVGKRERGKWRLWRGLRRKKGGEDGM